MSVVSGVRELARLGDIPVPDFGDCTCCGGDGDAKCNCDTCGWECSDTGCCQEGCSSCDGVREACERCGIGGGAVCMCNLLADGLDKFSGPAERLADLFWILGSPLAFPCVFLFPKSPPPYDEESFPNSWDRYMVYTPCLNPCNFLFAYACLPCGQYRLRKIVLNGDMSRYKCCQGYMDGPYCCAAVGCTSMPLVWTAGTYGEAKYPCCCLSLESTICCLCAFHASRQLMREERSLEMDPTEIRIERCIAFFHEIAHYCWCCGCCFYCAGCCLICLNPGSNDAERLGEASKRAGRACMRIAHIIWNGIWHVRWCSIGCMTAQMVHEARKNPDGGSASGSRHVTDGTTEGTDTVQRSFGQSSRSVAPSGAIGRQGGSGNVVSTQPLASSSPPPAYTSQPVTSAPRAGPLVWEVKGKSGWGLFSAGDSSTINRAYLQGQESVELPGGRRLYLAEMELELGTGKRLQVRTVKGQSSQV